MLGIISSSTTCHGRETSGQFYIYQTLVRRFGLVGRAAWWLICKINSLDLRLHRFLVCDAAHDKKRLRTYPWFDEWLEGYFQYQKDLDSHATGAWLGDLYYIDTGPELPKVCCPVLLLYGENDPYVSPTARLAFLDGLKNNPDVTDRVFPETGHLHMLEAPEAFEGAVLDFIHSLPATAVRNAETQTET